MVEKRMKTLSILIPAYNEEKNIGNLIGDLTSQKISICELEAVIVYSDSSTDNTIHIVKSSSNKNMKIKLVEGKNRVGKGGALNCLFRNIESDIAVLLDADIRLQQENAIEILVSYLINSNTVGLVSGNTRALKVTSHNIVSFASLFSGVILDQIRKYNPESIYAAHGRILALSKKLYKSLNVPDVAGVDQYIFLECRLSGMQFKFAPNAIVYYKVPTRFKDYFQQNIRFANSSKSNMKRYEEPRLLTINKGAKVVIESLTKHPIYGMAWICLFSLSKILSLRKFEINSRWERLSTTK